jgi:hypothetical protein
VRREPARLGRRCSGGRRRGRAGAQGRQRVLAGGDTALEVAQADEQRDHADGAGEDREADEHGKGYHGSDPHR